MVSYTADEEGYAYLEKEVEQLKGVLYTSAVKTGATKTQFEVKNEGFKTSGQVQYVAVAGNFAEAGFVYIRRPSDTESHVKL